MIATLRCAALCAVSLVALAAISASVSAQQASFPTKPVTIIVPNAAGGSSEILARMLQPKLTELLKQPVLVVARAGGNGIIGMEAVMRSPADGHTVLFGNTHNFVRIYLDAGMKPPFTPKDFLPVVMVGETPLAIVAHPSLPVRSLKELIDYAKANPGKLSFGAQSSRSYEMDLIRSDQKIAMVSVPYPGGSGEIVRDLIGGHIQLTAATTSSVISHIRSGAFRALVLMSDRRDPALPDVPTVVEAGYPDYKSSLWFGISAPAATPRAAADRLNAAFASALSDDNVKAQFLKRAVIARPGSSAEFQQFITSELARWRKVVDAIDMKK